MSGRGETRVLRQEAGQESPRMPAWKREILERRKAKGGAGAAASPPGGDSSSALRVSNGEVTGNGSGSSSSGPTTKDNNATTAGSSSSSSGRNYTVNTASQHFASKRGGDLSPAKTNKDDAAFGDGACEGHHHHHGESLVLHDSLGPLEDNPFIKLEKERKRRQDRENAARPVQHILELYGSVPGIRTIRAENIIIIESDPDYFPEPGGGGHHQNGVSSYSSLSDLLDRRGSAVTEIRAKEVVIYDTTLSKSEENLSTLGHDGLSFYETSEGGQGRVSRMLQKFDSNYYGKLQKKSRSTENLLELSDISCTSSRPRLRTMPPQPDLVPKYTSHPQPGSPVRNMGTAPFSAPLSPVFQSSQSSKPKPAVPETDRPHHHAQPPQPASVVSPKPKVPCSPETRRVCADPSPARPISSRTPQISSEFEIRPSPKPDLTSIPEGDAQARALANLRLQSRNSFTVIPKRRSAAAGQSSPGSTAPSTPVKSPPSSQKAAEVPTLGVPTPHITLTSVPTSSKGKVSEEKEEMKRAFKPASATTVMSPPPSPTRLSPSSSFSFAPASPSKTKEVDNLKLAFEQKKQGKKVFRPKSATTTSLSPPASPTRLSPTSSPVDKARVPEQKEEVKRAFKPASATTSMSPPPSPTHFQNPVLPILAPVHRAPSPVSSPVFSPVSSPVPSVSPPASPVPSDPPSPASVEPLVPLDRLPITNIDDIDFDTPQTGPPPTPSPVVQRRGGKTFTVVPKRLEGQQQQQQQDGQPGSTPPTQAPYAQLGSLLKKRYPAVEEIEVIGGYLSLAKSCLAKTGSAGKKMKISFNESSLSSTYEYPSESCVWDSGDEDEEESVRREGKVADDQPSMVGRIHIPRPTFTSSPTHTTNNTDLSSYVPKHSVDFNAWQEHKLDDPVYQGDANSQRTQMSEEVMLTPADSSSLSDFSSEPALYF